MHISGSLSGFSPDTPASSTTKTGLHDIVEILLKVVLNTINQIKSKSVFSTKLGNGLLNLIFDLVSKTHTNELFILRYCTVLYVTKIILFSIVCQYFVFLLPNEWSEKEFHGYLTKNIQVSLPINKNSILNHLWHMNKTWKFKMIQIDTALYYMSPSSLICWNGGNENYVTVLHQTKMYLRDHSLWNLNFTITYPSFESFWIYRFYCWHFSYRTCAFCKACSDWLQLPLAALHINRHRVTLKIRLTMPRVKMSRADRNPWLAKMWRFICNAASGSCNQSEQALQKAHVL
jgi:hypothetical protein